MRALEKRERERERAIRRNCRGGWVAGLDGSPPPAVLVPRRVPTFPVFCLHVTYTPPPFPRIRSISPFIYLRTSIDVDLFVRLLRRTSPFVLQ